MHIYDDEIIVKSIPDEDIRMFLNALPTWRDKLIFKLIYFAGVRISEVLNLQIEDIPNDNNQEQFRILKDIEYRGNKRNLYVLTVLVNEIDDFIMKIRCNVDTENGYSKHGYLFVSQKKKTSGSPLTYNEIYQVFNKTKKKTGIQFTFNDLRHAGAVFWLKNNVDIRVVSLMLGHENVGITFKQYTNILI